MNPINRTSIGNAIGAAIMYIDGQAIPLAEPMSLTYDNETMREARQMPESPSIALNVTLAPGTFETIDALSRRPFEDAFWRIFMVPELERLTQAAESKGVEFSPEVERSVIFQYVDGAYTQSHVQLSFEHWCRQNDRIQAAQAKRERKAKLNLRNSPR